MSECLCAHRRPVLGAQHLGSELVQSQKVGITRSLLGQRREPLLAAFSKGQVPVFEHI